MNNFEKNSKVISEKIVDTGENTNALITFLIPTYNRYDKLIRALDSINNQKKDAIDYNIVVVDNNSELIITEDFLNKMNSYHNLKYYVNSENIGMFGNWNRGIELVNTKYISMLHDDDTVQSNYLIIIKSILKNLRKKNVGYIKASSIDIMDSIPPKIMKRRLLNRLLRTIFKKRVIKISKKYIDYVGDLGFLGAPSCGSIMLKSAFVEIGGYDETYYPSSDVYPLIDMIGKYEIYESFGFLGYRFFGENESCKPETVIRWYINGLDIMERLSKKTKHSVKIYKKYKEEMLFIYVNTLKHTPLKDNLTLSDEDFDYVYKTKQKKNKVFSLKIKKRIIRYISILKGMIGIK